MHAGTVGVNNIEHHSKNCKNITAEGLKNKATADINLNKRGEAGHQH